MKPPLFSVTRNEFKATYSFNNINYGFEFEDNYFKLETIELNHPNPTLGFKLISNNKSIVYFTDNELIQDNHSSQNLKDLIISNHSELIKFCKNADVLIHDTSYLMDDYNKRIGWGHSSNLAAAMFAHLAGVRIFTYSITTLLIQMK